MTVDKTALKKLIDTSKPSDISFLSFSAIENDSARRIKSEVDKFLSKSSDYVLIFIKK
jgi:hypothetical protein